MTLKLDYNQSTEEWELTFSKSDWNKLKQGESALFKFSDHMSNPKGYFALKIKCIKTTREGYEL